jgi:hypothetical protein
MSLPRSVSPPFILGLLSFLDSGCSQSFAHEGLLLEHFKASHHHQLHRHDSQKALRPTASPFSHTPQPPPPLPADVPAYKVCYIQLEHPHKMPKMPAPSLLGLRTAQSLQSLRATPSTQSLASSQRKKPRLTTRPSPPNDSLEDEVILRKLSDLPKKANRTQRTLSMPVATRAIPRPTKEIQLSAPASISGNPPYPLIPSMTVTFSTFSFRYVELEHAGLLDGNARTAQLTILEP